jgi:ABC-type branched-subunit amino acid transport system substrate-binding protein
MGQESNAVPGSRAKSWRPGWAAGLVAVAALLLTACGGAGTAGPASGPPIKIGVLDDNAPGTAIEGAEMRVNTDLAVAQINDAGGVHGHKLQVVYADPQGQPDQAINLAQQLVQQQGVDVLVGAVLSSECLGVENLVPRLQVAYLSSTGCAAEDFTSKQCNRYSFRVSPVGRMSIIPLASYLVKTYGKRWAIIYPDYAFGQSQVAAYRVGLQAVGGELAQTIAIPQNEANMTPYISKIPTDGSISGLINSEVSADLVRSSQVLMQFGINKKMPIVGVFGRERFGGTYPDSLNGDLGYSPELSTPARGNQYDVAYHKAFDAQVAKEPANVVNTLGGAEKALPGDLGYQAYSTMTALKEAMLASNYTGKQDTNKLINALATLKAKQGPDFPGGDFQMNPTDHQGQQTTYITKISGQNEDVLATYPADQLPSIGNCQVK